MSNVFPSRGGVKMARSRKFPKYSKVKLNQYYIQSLNIIESIKSERDYQPDET